MTKAMTWLLALALGLGLGTAGAEEFITFQGCRDAAGRPVATQADATLARVVESAHADGRAVVRYNPELLPTLGEGTRLFFYAHECARHELGIAAAPRGLDEARRADCAGLATLLRSKLLAPRDVRGIESDPALDAQAWTLLPGPQRPLALGACLAELAARPSLAHPVAAQPAWNRCVHACGEPLRTCRRECRGAACEACQARYDQCSASCDARNPL